MVSLLRFVLFHLTTLCRRFEPSNPYFSGCAQCKRYSAITCSMNASLYFIETENGEMEQIFQCFVTIECKWYSNRYMLLLMHVFACYSILNGIKSDMNSELMNVKRPSNSLLINFRKCHRKLVTKVRTRNSLWKYKIIFFISLKHLLCLD